jgi:imidazolonepropionase-like amidohydrolase
MRSQSGIHVPKRTLLLLAFLAALVLINFGFGTLRAASAPGGLALIGARIYPAPDAPTIAGGTVLIRDAKITWVGPSESLKVPADAATIDCHGMVIMAGFQNSHVHFTEPKWNDAGTRPAADLAEQLQKMLTQYGFTTVVDTGSFLANTNALRSRVESGEVAGPRILTAGEILFPVGGIPYYARSALDPSSIARLPQPASPQTARRIVDDLISHGADIIKLYGVSFVTRRKTVAMKLDVAKAAVDEAHRQGKLVFMHPSTGEGLEIALNSNVDVIAHAVEFAPMWNDATIARMKTQHIAMIPTLTLFRPSALSGVIERVLTRTDVLAQVASYWRAGGQILFGTDAGFIPTYDPTREYVLMGRAGISVKGILESLTTAPVERFGEAAWRGRIERGMDADLVVLGGDPADDIRWFAGVRYTIRGGRIIYSGAQRPPETNLSALALLVSAGLIAVAVWLARRRSAT